MSKKSTPLFQFVHLNKKEGAKCGNPTKGHESSACYDIEYLGAERTLINQSTTTILLNLAFIIEEGYHIEIYSRSGLTAKYGIVIKNAPAIIDHHFSGGIQLILENRSRLNYELVAGTKIAQFRLVKGEVAPLTEGTLEMLEIYENDELNTRKSGGLGSTDKFVAVDL